MKRPGGHAHAFTRQKEQTVCLTQTPQQLYASKTKVFCSQQRAEYICLMCDEIHLAIIHVSPAYYIRTHTHTLSDNVHIAFCRTAPKQSNILFEGIFFDLIGTLRSCLKYSFRSF